MSLVDGWLWLFMGLIAVGFIILLLRLLKPKPKTKDPSILFGARQIQDWERMFAWKPVRVVEGNWIWLKVYWQRKVYAPADEDGLFDENSWYYQKVTQIGWYLW